MMDAIIVGRPDNDALNRYRNALRLERFWKLRNTPPQKTLLEAALAMSFFVFMTKGSLASGQAYLLTYESICRCCR